MYTKPPLTRPSVSIVVAAALAAVIAVGMLTLVVEGFHGRGKPLQALAVAERACSAHRYVSERETCMREWLAAKRGHSVADKSATR
jgi:hypothetical protein